jgi:hypothetical protein
VKLTTHLPLVPRLRMRELYPPLPQYVFVALCLIKQESRLQGQVAKFAVTFIYIYIYIYISASSSEQEENTES